ncbi:MAG: enoyl-CoA hydratase/isomerase family protein [Xanthomonadales bacterium]|nr:enoyl-CoA hydratase/isomerase family protein [Xanthomonadales bacterium]
MRFETIRYETEGPLAWITLDRPDKLNAVSKKMVAELNQALDAAEADGGVRVILLKGAGRAFSAGFDLEVDTATIRAPDEELAALKKELQNDFDLIMRFWNSAKPTVAAVHGYCLGGALEMAIACDLTVAAEACRFGEPEVKFGSGIVALLLPWICGPKRAREILLTGDDRITARQAEIWGLVNRVVAEDELIDCAHQLARQIAANDQLAVRLTKQALNDACEFGSMRDALVHALQLSITIESTETEESTRFNEILRSEGARAAIAWRQKRIE